MGTVHESTATDEISVKLFNQTKNYLEKYFNVTNFSPTAVILGTWYKGTPYPYYNYLGKNEVGQVVQVLLYRIIAGDLLLIPKLSFNCLFLYFLV